MGNFQTKMALLGLSFVFAGCTTPFVEVTVNGEGFSDGSGGACRPPQICGGGAQFPRGESGEIVKVGKAFAILDDRSKQVEYFLVDDPGVTLGVTLAKDLDHAVGTKVSIARTNGKVEINKKEEKK